MEIGQATRTAFLRAELAAALLRLLPDEGDFQTAVPGLWMSRRNRPCEPTCQLYGAAFALVAQGSKVVESGGRSYRYSAGEWLLTTLHLPIASRIDRASPDSPYLSCFVLLDLAEGQQMLAEHDLLQPDREADRAITTGHAEPELLDAMLRLLRLQDTPADAPVLSSLLQREIVYRLARGPKGNMLRQIITAGSCGQRVAEALAWLRANFREPLRVEELAGRVHMATSTLHHNFRAVTGMSPMQYQKQLRLFEARRLMLRESMDAASAAFATGYESPTQFSREYRRQFGRPPMRDIQALRDPAATPLYSSL